MRSRRARVPNSTYADPVVIDEVLTRLAGMIRADGNRDLLAHWAVAVLANKMGITIIQTDSRDPVEVIRDLGTDWAALLIQLNKDHPEGAHRALLAAGQAFEVIRRGMQPG